jgi:hypothetical protein
MKPPDLKKGVNLGGWLSQYPAFDEHHFDSFIRAEDLRRIADWGFDHVRLPVDYPVLEDEQHPGEYRPGGFERLDQALAWCRENDLRVILDLHKAPGYAFDSLGTVSLFRDAAQQDRLLALWRELARRFGGQQEWVALELLNEIVLKDGSAWNALYPRLVAEIRREAPESLIVLGGNQYNAADQLQHLDVLQDERILYTFHFYNPMVVTHYKAGWVPWLFEYGELVEYPGIAPAPAAAFLTQHDPGAYPELTPGLRFDRAYLAGLIQPAVEFARTQRVPVYCGEFGVIDQAPLANRIRWTRDMVSLLREQEIGYGYWSYKAMDFGLVDRDGRLVDRELVDILTGK